jgi:lysophospholipid hydrolase
LIAGDTLNLGQDKSFYCVVEGTVQVYAQTGHEPEVPQGSWDDEHMNGYQLLNEVGSGGTLSSLFTILSLFTEDVQMSWQDEFPDVTNDEASRLDPEEELSYRAATETIIPPLDLSGNPTRPSPRPRRSSESSNTTSSTVHAAGSRFTSSPSSYSSFGAGMPSFGTSRASDRAPLHPNQTPRGVIARATEDTTLAVIPAEAFKRLTKKHPKATGHIVQGKASFYRKPVDV